MDNKNFEPEYDDDHGDDFICVEEAELLSLLTNPSFDEIVKGEYNDETLQIIKELQEKIEKKANSKK